MKPRLNHQHATPQRGLYEPARLANAGRSHLGADASWSAAALCRLPLGTSRFHSGRGLPHCKTWRLVAGFAASVLALLVSWAVPPAHSQSTVSLGSDGAAQGHSVELPLWLDNSAHFAALQVDFVFDPLFVNTNGLSVRSALANLLVDGGVVAPDRYRVVLLSTNRLALPSGEIARITFAARSNSPNGLLRVSLRTPPGVAAVSVTTSGICASGLDFQAGQFLVGDAFGFVDGIGRVQFRTVDGATNVFQASTNLHAWLPKKTDASFEDLVIWTNVFQTATNLTKWVTIGSNVGSNELVIWMDRDVTNYPHRFYKVNAP